MHEKKLPLYMSPNCLSLDWKTCRWKNNSFY